MRGVHPTDTEILEMDPAIKSRDVGLVVAGLGAGSFVKYAAVRKM
jgi:hypothetical protein